MRVRWSTGMAVSHANACGPEAESLSARRCSGSRWNEFRFHGCGEMALEVMWLLALVEVGVELFCGSSFEGFLEIWEEVVQCPKDIFQICPGEEVWVERREGHQGC